MLSNQRRSTGSHSENLGSILSSPASDHQPRSRNKFFVFSVVTQADIDRAARLADPSNSPSRSAPPRCSGTFSSAIYEKSCWTTVQLNLESVSNATTTDYLVLSACGESKLSVAQALETSVTNARAHEPSTGMVWSFPAAPSMGSDRHYPEEAPVHRSTVGDFWIDRYPVTNRQFKEIPLLHR